MESIGKYLRTQRESQNKSLQEVSESTKIRELLLRAIEEDRYDLISSPVYVKGFLDAYARYLGLDPSEITLQYQENYVKKNPLKSPGSEQRKTSSSLERSIAFSKRRVAFWLLIISIFVMVVLIGLVIYRTAIKFRHGSPPSSEEKTTITPVPPVASPPPIQEEVSTETTDSPEKVETPPEKNETPQPTDTKKNRRGKKPDKNGLRRKGEKARQNEEQD